MDRQIEQGKRKISARPAPGHFHLSHFTVVRKKYVLGLQGQIGNQPSGAELAVSQSSKELGGDE